MEKREYAKCYLLRLIHKSNKWKELKEQQVNRHTRVEILSFDDQALYEKVWSKLTQQDFNDSIEQISRRRIRISCRRVLEEILQQEEEDMRQIKFKETIDCLIEPYVQKRIYGTS